MSIKFDDGFFESSRLIVSNSSSEKDELDDDTSHIDHLIYNASFQKLKRHIPLEITKLIRDLEHFVIDKISYNLSKKNNFCD